mmetsp:Transcript_14858/g.23030  ORF Transcript_14858/g.23030 Transcript_14858/m.23030 type:complete len:85 (+) Transcript_14858:1075-1329(+)
MNAFTDANMHTRNNLDPLQRDYSRGRSKSNQDLPTLIEGDESSQVIDDKKSLDFGLAPSTGRNEGSSRNQNESKTEPHAFQDLF